MDVTTYQKTDFIKFNVSPRFKALAAQKARTQGMTLSELGRMLLGAYITGVIKPSLEIDPEFLKLAEEARQAHREGKGTLIETAEELEDFLKTLWAMPTIRLHPNFPKKLQAFVKYDGRKKKAAQYGSRFDKSMETLARQHGFSTKMKYLGSLG